MNGPDPRDPARRAVRIAIDGPSGVGKSTVARALARALDLQFVDTGAMYRAVGLVARERGVDLGDGEAVGRLARGLRFAFPVRAGALRTVVDGTDVSERIRTEQASMDASTVSKLPAVRQALVALQQQLAEGGGVVMEGRDIGTVVMPGAEVKVFLDARPEVRGRRRHRELQARGEDVTLAEVIEAIERRDHQDRTRATSPLRPADDAFVLDTSDRSADQVVQAVVDLVRSAETPATTT